MKKLGIGDIPGLIISRSSRAHCLDNPLKRFILSRFPLAGCQGCPTDRAPSVRYTSACSIRPFSGEIRRAKTKQTPENRGGTHVEGTPVFDDYVLGEKMISRREPSPRRTS
jgi:hypothetical protein